jgi:hypothetical protein
MRYVTIGRYQFSAILLLVAAIASPLAFAATYYAWSSKTVPFSVDEPLSVVDFPASTHLHPGENVTIEVTVANSASIDYDIRLIITLSDPDYQQAYIQASNYTYAIAPGNNTISAWIAASSAAPPSQQQLTVDFIRL